MFETIKSKWSEIIQAVVDFQDLSSISYKTWLLPLEPVSMDGSTLVIYYPGAEQGKKYITDKYLYFIQTATETITGIKCDIRIVTVKNSFVPDSTEKAESSSAATLQTVNGSKLNPKYTFDSFVVGNNNKIAHAACLAVAESPGETWNPLFLYGGVGLGKTHLMHAIAIFIKQQNPSANVLYTSCENFKNDLVDSIRNKNNFDFREKYRNVDVLLIDDIQFLSKGEFIQEEIFNTFNYLYDSGKQIVFACDRPPKEIDNIDERISSRFLSGLPVDIQSPDYETRVAILKKKEEAEGYNIDNEVINFIASKIKSNIRELEGALKKVIAYSKLNGNKEINLALAEEALKDHLTSSVVEITPERIRDVVAEHFGLSINDLASEKRSKDIAFARHIAMFLSCTLTRESLENIARVLGKKDHSTVIHGREKIQAEIETNESLRNTIDILKKKLSPN